MLEDWVRASPKWQVLWGFPVWSGYHLSKLVPGRISSDIDMVAQGSLMQVLSEGKSQVCSNFKEELLYHELLKKKDNMVTIDTNLDLGPVKGSLV